MDTLGLSLRQKKLLHLLKGMDTFVTGSTLARQMNVSARTIRSDVAGINQALLPYQARIYSEHSKGYLYIARDPEAIRKMNQIDNAFFTRDERVRYLSFRFCLSDIPLNIYDLEDEVFVSHTTLEHDLRQLKIKYVLSDPHIPLIQNKDFLSFAKDEKKRRYILNHLFHEDWDYHSRDNAFYGYHFLDKQTMSFLMEEIPAHLSRHGIFMEDPSLVSLNLAMAIMYHRVRSGHPLPDEAPVERTDLSVSEAADELFSSLENSFGIEFSRAEQDEIYRMIADTSLPDISGVSFQNVSDCFDPVILELSDTYLRRVEEVFGLDFSRDEDFYITLCSYLRYLTTSQRIYNAQENPDILRENLLPEYEIAWLFQDLALQYLGDYLSQTELLYLAHCISGALEYLADTHPENKLRTVICCHLNMPAIWALKRKVLGAFDKYLDIKGILPVNSKNVLDFDKIDLVLSTVRKTITNHPGTDTIQIGTLLPPKDYLTISSYIQKSRIKRLCPHESDSLEKLLSNAIWLEKIKPGDRFAVIETMCGVLLSEGVIPQAFEADLLRREAISTFAFHSDLLLLYSLVPASRTQLLCTVFDHRISWNNHKIRIAVMAAFSREDSSLVFLLNQVFNDPSLDPEDLKALHSREEICRFFIERNSLPSTGRAQSPVRDPSPTFFNDRAPVPDPQSPEKTRSAEV